MACVGEHAECLKVAAETAAPAAVVADSGGYDDATEMTVAAAATAPE